MQLSSSWRENLPGQPREVLRLVGIALGAGLLVGFVTAAFSPLYAFAGLVGLLAGLMLLANSATGLLAFVSVAALLPFAVVPVQLGLVKLTFLDFVLLALLLAWIGRLLTHNSERLRGGSLGGALLVFILLALVSFAAGTAYAVTAETTRLFLKIVNSLLLYFTVLNCVRSSRHVERLMAALIVVASAAAVFAIVLYYLPGGLATEMLTALRPLGYPSSDVLRYIAGTNTQRAIGTAIDPNILGALLMLASTIAVGQAVSPYPVLRRRYVLLLLVPLLGALLLSYSRSSWMGLAVASMFIGTLRYRRLWLAFVPLAVALYFGILPQGEGFVGHLQSGLQFQDQASAMRLGEYRDALRLISQYPLFGVGFGSAPSIDLYLGVSSIYLLIAEEMGLIGLAAFLITMMALFWRGLRSFSQATDERRKALLLSLLAAVLAALVAGAFDHHFFNLRFPHTVALFWFLIGLTVVVVDEQS